MESVVCLRMNTVVGKNFSLGARLSLVTVNDYRLRWTELQSDFLTRAMELYTSSMFRVQTMHGIESLVCEIQTHICRDKSGWFCIYFVRERRNNTYLKVKDFSF